MLRYWQKQDLSRIHSDYLTARNKFLSRLGWIIKYQKELSIYQDILSVFQAAKQLLITQGLHSYSYLTWLELSQDFPQLPWIQENIQKVTQYLIEQGKKIPRNETFPAITDVIESLFSQYKALSDNAPYSEINEIVLSLVLFTTKITPKKVLQAMNSIDTSTLKKWLKEFFGESLISKRKAAFSDS